MQMESVVGHKRGQVLLALPDKKRKSMGLFPAQLHQNDIFFPETNQRVIQLWSDLHAYALYMVISDYEIKVE